MKSFKEYITEGKRVYEFKIKIAGDCPKDCAKQIKEALSSFKVESCSSGKSAPIAAKHNDFPKLENVGVTVFDVCLAYPTTSVQVREEVANKLKCSPASVRVRNSKEEEELALNNEHSEKSGESLLTKEYDTASEGQSLVGEKHTMSLLKQLGKMKSEAELVTGTNDVLLAKSAPIEKVKSGPAKVNTKSTVGGKKVTLPTAKSTGGL